MPGRPDPTAASLAGLFLARHGETDYNRHRRFQGHLPVPLNARGREQAGELARAAAGEGFGALWCSPLARARETADIVGERVGLEPREDARLAETDAGEWTDRTFEEVQRSDPEGFAAFVGGHADFAFPGGESFAAQSDRVMAALGDIAEEGTRPALIVCHGVVIRLALARLGLTRGESPASIPVANAALIAL